MTPKLWSCNLSRLTHLSYNKDSGASHRLKFACSHNSHLVPQRKTEQNPLKKSLLIHKSLCWNVSHYCLLCLSVKSAALKQGKQENMKQIIADHAIPTTKDKCLKNCSLEWKACWRCLGWTKYELCVQGFWLRSETQWFYSSLLNCFIVTTNIHI